MKPKGHNAKSLSLLPLFKRLFWKIFLLHSNEKTVDPPLHMRILNINITYVTMLGPARKKLTKPGCRRYSISSPWLGLGELKTALENNSGSKSYPILSRVQACCGTKAVTTMPIANPWALAQSSWVRWLKIVLLPNCRICVNFNCFKWSL